MALQIDEDEHLAKALHSSQLASIGEMASNIAHELNTPLMILSGKTDILANLAKTPNPSLEKIEALHQQIESTIDRMARIILSLKKLSRNGVGAKKSKASLKSVLDDVLNISQERFKAHDIKIFVEDFTQNSDVFINEIEISQVFINILNNAFDALNTQTSYRWIRVKLESSQSGIHVNFSNSGEKIPTEIEDKIFTPFFTTKAIGKGTGIGLSISQSILHAHNGKISLVKNATFTTFSVSLPHYLGPELPDFSLT